MARKTVRDISKALSIKAKISDFKVTNIVANAKIEDHQCGVEFITEGKKILTAAFP